MLGNRPKIFRTREQIEAEICSFSTAAWARMEMVARIFARGTGWDHNDLLQEAIMRTLQDTRHCPADVDLIKHLADTTRSIADGERNKGYNLHPHAPILQTGDDRAENPPFPAWSAEDTLLYDSNRAELLALFDDDPVAHELLDGMLAGFDTDELKELTGLQGTSYNSKRTLIRRRLVKYFSKERSV